MLDQIKKANSNFAPLKILCYGVPGIGKTTFGASFENPVLLPVEDGANAIDIMALPQVFRWDEAIDEEKRPVPSIVGAVNALHGEHDYKTLVVDSVDWLEPLIHNYVCSVNDVESIEQVMGGYGKGYGEAKKIWSHFVAGLDSLRFNKGMNIVLVAHSEIKKIEPPDSDPYDRYQMCLHKAAAALLDEWSDIHLFTNYEVKISKEEASFGKERKRGIGTGQRVLHTSERPSFKAKNRWSLPEEIFIGKDKSWAAFHAALAKATDNKYINPQQEKK